MPCINFYLTPLECRNIHIFVIDNGRSSMFHDAAGFCIKRQTELFTVINIGIFASGYFNILSDSENTFKIVRFIKFNGYYAQKH